jgi:hypothetical protein
MNVVDRRFPFCANRLKTVECLFSVYERAHLRYYTTNTVSNTAQMIVIISQEKVKRLLSLHHK